jgi:hypothetical protein
VSSGTDGITLQVRKGEGEKMAMGGAVRMGTDWFRLTCVLGMLLAFVANWELFSASRCKAPDGMMTLQ